MRRVAARALAPAAVALAALALAAAAPGPAPAAAARTAARPAVATPAPPADPWREARRLADAAEHDSALAVLRAALRRGDDFGLRWLEAGITGEAGRHAESVALYERLAADHPDRAAELGADLAGERLRADDAPGAARGFRAWLADHPDDRDARRGLAAALARGDSLASALAELDALLASDPGDTAAALERARLLGWMGRHEDAMRAYRAVLEREPASAAARLGLAMNENWSGRHRRATRRLEALAAEPGADPEVTRTLAFARWWDGDPDGARRELDRYLAVAPDDAEARALSRLVERERRPTLRVAAGRADDSDGLRVNTTEAELALPVATGTTAFAGARRDNLKDSGGVRDPLRLWVGLRRRWSPAWTTYAAFTHTDWEDSAGVAAGGEAGVVARPVDRLRLEAAVGREPVLTRRALDRGVSLLSWIAAADLQATPKLALHLDGRAGRYSDGNRSERVSAAARLETFASRRGSIALTFGMTQLNTRLDLDNGYYDPDFHREWGPGLDLEWRPKDDLVLGLETQVGEQHEKGGDDAPFFNIVGRASARPGAGWLLTLEGGHSDSSLQSAAGYERDGWMAALTREF